MHRKDCDPPAALYSIRPSPDERRRVAPGVNDSHSGAYCVAVVPESAGPVASVLECIACRSRNGWCYPRVDVVWDFNLREGLSEHSAQRNTGGSSILALSASDDVRLPVRLLPLLFAAPTLYSFGSLFASAAAAASRLLS
ncbi:hypothetical protein MKEN_00403400 [Mycena kentingensis (nom. inval.)]|nr:hypothetical protein MKEN_00403400 [Mycena kentingensis (nom. inval.)]